EVLEDTVRGGEPPDHLREWIDIVRSSNPARNRIPRFARIFKLQHFMRVLYSRHAATLNRKKGAVCDAVAEFFEVDRDVIRRDVRFVESHLTRDWAVRPNPLNPPRRGRRVI